MIPAMLTLTALIAYFIGSISTVNLTSNLYFHCNILKKYPRDNEGITRFWMENGFKGTAVLFGTEIVKTLIPVLIGGLLMNITGHADVGFAFAMFCVALGTVFPIIYDFKGETCLVAVAVAMLLIRPGITILAAIAFAVMYFIKHYISLSAAVGAVAMWFVSILTVDSVMVRRLVFLTAVLIIIENRKGLVRLVKGEEKEFRFRKDLSYMFDEVKFSESKDEQ